MFSFLSLSLVANLAFVSLAYGLTHSQHFQVIDRLLQRRFFLHPFLKSISKICFLIFSPRSLVLWDFLLAGILFVKHRYLAGVWALATLAFTDLCGLGVKYYFKRPRPFNHHLAQNGWSFPSGHLLGATTMILLIWSLFGSKIPWPIFSFLLFLGLLIAFARLDAGDHYPADLLGAVFLSIACFALSNAILLLIQSFY